MIAFNDNPDATPALKRLAGQILRLAAANGEVQAHSILNTVRACCGRAYELAGLIKGERKTNADLLRAADLIEADADAQERAAGAALAGASS